MKAFKIYSGITGFLIVSYFNIKIKELFKCLLYYIANPDYRWFLMFTFIY